MEPRARSTRRALLHGGVLASLGVAGCLQGTRAGEEPGPPDGEAVRWTHWTGGSVRHAPTLADGVVYVGGGSNDRATPDRDFVRPEHSEDVLALAASDGTEQWRYEAAAGVAAGPVVRDGVFVVVGWDATTHGRDQRLVRLDDGSRTWATDRFDVYLRLLDVGEEAAYAGTADDQVGVDGQELLAFDVADGGERWSVDAGDAWGGTLHGDTLYLEEGTRRTTARDVADGTERWHAGSSVSGDPRVFGDLVFVEAGEDEAGNHPVAAVDASDGTERWRFAPPVDEPFVPTGAVATDDLAFVTEYGGWLFGLDREDGSEQWRRSVDGDTTDPPVVVGDRVYLTSDDGTVHALDAATGERRWTRSPGVRPRIEAAGASGLVVAGGGEETDAYVRAYVPDGIERWSFTSSEPLTGAAVSGLRAYVATRRGHVVALGEA